MALVVVKPDETKKPVEYSTVFIYRWPLQLSNTVMISDIKQVLSKLPDNVYLNVDYTGKGQVFAEFLERKFGEPPRLHNVMTDYSIFSKAMKENLASTTRILLSEGRLKFCKGQGVYSEMLDELFDELCNYQVHIKESPVKGKPTSEMGALGYGEHDDLATALFLALEDAEQAPSTGEVFWIRR